MASFEIVKRSNLLVLTFPSQEVDGGDVGREHDAVDDVDDAVLSLEIGFLHDGVFDADRFAVNGQSQRILLIQRHVQLFNIPVSYIALVMIMTLPQTLIETYWVRLG